MKNPTVTHEWMLTGGGVTGDLIRSLDWEATPVGPMHTWPASLRVLVQTLLRSRQPMFLWWGAELTQFYNDAYLPSFGEGKHPKAMGQSGRDCWGEIWSIIWPQIDAVMREGTPTWHQDALVPIWRNGKIEEVFWTYGYSPAFGDDGQITGTLVVCTETTSGVLANRRLTLVAAVSEQAARAPTPAEVLDCAFPSLAGHEADVPFAAAFDARGRLTHHTKLTDAQLSQLSALGPAVVQAGAPRCEPLHPDLSTGPWPEPVREVFVVPLGAEPRSHLLFGLSPRLPFDASYRSFILQLANSIRTSQDRVQALVNRANMEADRRDLLLQAPLAAALLTGPELRYELANVRYVDMVGCEVVGKTYRQAHPEGAGSALLQRIEQVSRDGLPFSSEEMCVPREQRGTGELEDVYFKFAIQPIRGPNATIRGIMILAVDITEMVLARQTEQRAHAELQSAYHERAQLVAQLEAANRTKDEFMAILGHELRNPLAPIVTALELIRMRGDDSLSREHELIERQVHHLVRLVEDLLDVARIAQGKVQLKRTACDIGAVISNAVEMAESLLDQRKHRLTVDIPEPLPWYGDPTRLAQVIANLLTNAARYTPPAGEIAVSAQRDPEGGFSICVSDNGNGIAPESLQAIFAMFEQGPRTPDRAEGGLGLGLTLVKGLVELHGGRVHASSDGLSHGSRFEVWLPDTGQPRSTPPQDRLSEMSPMRIVVVDDNADAAEMLAHMLSRRGHEVQVAHDGASALGLVPRLKPQIGILDIGLPIMDGYELARRMLQLTSGNICLIAITGYGQESDAARCLEAGFAAHLVKPVSFEQLSRVMARHTSTQTRA